ncbi:MAG: nucleotidyltransferase family protein [Clostridiales bacterium]|nr:nucleotidyltransferase family protein [Clostridiales bacterium]
MTMQKDWTIERTPPEFRLMLLCSGKNMSEAQISEAKAIISGSVDWILFATLLDKHRLIPVVFDNLKKYFKEKADEPGLRKLATLRKQSMIRSMRIASAWVAITSAMEEADVRILHLKGPALSLRIYGDIDSRISKDLDLLVDLNDIDKADQVLKDAGYTRTVPASDMTPKQANIWYKNNHHYTYKGPNALIIELHFRLSRFLYETSFGELWDKRRVGRYGRTEYYYLSPEDELLFYAYHGARHGWIRLRWLLDVDELIQSGTANPARLAELAVERRLTRVLSQTFLLCKKFFRSEVTANYLAAVGSDGAARRLAEMAVPMVLAPEDVIKTFAFKKYGLSLEKGFMKKKRFVVMQFQPLESDFQSAKFSDRVFFAYYPVRMLNYLKRKLKRKERNQ